MKKITKGTNGRTVALFVGLAILSLAMTTYAAEVFDQPQPPCHPNPNAAQDMAALSARGDIVNLPQPLKDRLLRLAGRPHTYLPLQTGRDGKEVRTVFPVDLARIDQPQISLVHEHRCLKGIACPFPVHVDVCQTVQLVVNNRNQFF